jgi:hypothetical protein
MFMQLKSKILCIRSYAIPVIKISADIGIPAYNAAVTICVKHASKKHQNCLEGLLFQFGGCKYDVGTCVGLKVNISLTFF